MSTFDNFVQCRVASPIATSATSLELYAAVAPYNLPPETGGVLVLTDSPGNPSRIEVIRYASRSGLGLYGVERGQEGTTAIEWTGPVYCYQALMASEMQSILSSIESLNTSIGGDSNFSGTMSTELAKKAATVHTHDTSQVTGLDAALAGKVSNNDLRLTDSREWSADTVTQAEAEAGTASTRRAWTAQRVRQAIAAWYLTVSTTFTRTLLGRSTAAQVREDLGLGTAATRADDYFATAEQVGDISAALDAINEEVI